MKLTGILLVSCLPESLSGTLDKVLRAFFHCHPSNARTPYNSESGFSYNVPIFCGFKEETGYTIWGIENLW